MPHNNFHIGSARFRLSGLPVRIAIPINTPVCKLLKIQMIMLFYFIQSRLILL